MAGPKCSFEERWHAIVWRRGVEGRAGPKAAMDAQGQADMREALAESMFEERRHAIVWRYPKQATEQLGPGPPTEAGLYPARHGKRIS